HHLEELRLAMWRAGRADSRHLPEKTPASTRPAQTTAQALDEAIERSRKASIERQQADANAGVREVLREISEAKDQLARLTREGVESPSVTSPPVPTRKGASGMGSMILETNRGRNLGLRDLRELHEEHVRTEGHEMPG